MDGTGNSGGIDLRLFRISGVVLVLLSCVAAAVSHRFAYETVSEDRPFLTLTGVAILAFATYLFAVFSLRPRLNCRVRSGEVLEFAILMRLPLLAFSHPIQEIDYYRYLWDGRAIVEGVSPLRFSPANLDSYRLTSLTEAGTKDFVTIPREAVTLLAVLERSPAIREIFERIDHRGVTTIYPLVAQVVFAAAALITPESASLLSHILVLRGVLTGFDIGVIVMLILILNRLKLPVGLVISYAWCPLVLKEIANGSHMDGIAVFFTTAAFYASIIATQDENSNRTIKFSALSWLMLVLAIFSKLYPLVLVPIFAAYSLNRWKWWALLAMVPAIFLSVGMLVISSNAVNEKPSITRADASDDDMVSENPDGLSAFLSRWEMNDLLFSVVRENLRVPDLDSGSAPRPEPWYAITPDSVRRSWARLISHFSFGREPIAPDFAGARIICSCLLGLFILAQSIKLLFLRESGAKDLGECAFLTLAASWYLSATQNPWYWVWGLPFLEFARSRVWTLVSGFALLYYVRFWLIYQFPDPFWQQYSGRRFFDEVVVWFEHLPLLLAVLFDLIWRNRTNR